MKIGDLVGYTPDGVRIEAWRHWQGLVIKEIPGTDERLVIMWNRDNNVKTALKKKDLELISESR